MRDEGSELQSARERNGDRCGRPSESDGDGDRAQRSDATCGTTKTGKVGSNEKGGGREGGNCDYRARVTETVEARRITGEDACGASGGHHRYVEGDEE